MTARRGVIKANIAMTIGNQIARAAYATWL